MTERNDSLVADYLAAVARATAGLPRDRRDELVRDLREHIEAGRAELPDETEHQVREILERLGEPAVIAAVAAEDIPVATPVASPVRTPPDRRPLWILATIAAIGLLFVLCAGFLFFAQTNDGPPEPAQPAPVIQSDGAS
ncbi:hypothetical protein AB0M02_41795 [Actinoplanes sp. NPDC051861]|uniref:HAAS signaling domain-containing protein n=1 Tax=Actinoplanes sp. NPDC051861 TaxID=3155170 RepID=UPI00343ED027